MKLKVFEAFAGVGSQRMALRNLGVEHEVVAISEIDKFAIKSYEAIHGETYNVGDISQVNVSEIPNHDLFTYSFPCQDISLAGKQSGLDKDSGTRSSLLWDCEKVIKHKRPKYLMLENVKNLVSKKFKHNFDEWLSILENYGYTNYWEVLNAKDYGIPQNRERVFVISILEEHIPYEFPIKQELTLRLKDLLESAVDEKYYLSDEQISKIKSSKFNQNKTRIQNKDVCQTLCARDYKDPKCVRVGQYIDDKGIKHQSLSVYDKVGIAPTLDTMRGGHLEPHIIEDKFKSYDSKNEIGAVIGSTQKNATVTDGSFSPTLTSSMGTGGGHTPMIVQKSHGYNKGGYKDLVPSLTTSAWQENNFLTLGFSQKVRKLTPKECWRLMGFSDEDFYKASEVNSNSQLYKQAGNSIVVNVLEAMFKNLFTGVIDG